MRHGQHKNRYYEIKIYLDFNHTFYGAGPYIFSCTREIGYRYLVDQNNEPLPGASVVVVGTSRGVQTDFDGNYSILVSVGEVLRFSYIGQMTEERTVGSEDVINVQLIQEAQELQEIVLQGYRTAKRAKSSVASQTLTDATIKNRPNANVLQTLSGQVAGLEVNTVSGQPGAAPTVRIRGINSINGNTAPLFIIDGTPVDEDNFRSINPQEIASVDVLKDAAATAVYGNRGANGVVVIKTKQGRFNTPLQLNYTGILGFSSLQDNDYNLMKSQEQLTLENQRGRGLGAGLSPEEIAAVPTYNWDEYFFRTGLTQSHNLSFQGGGDRFSQYTSLGFFDQEGILRDSDLKRFNIRNNTTGKSANDRLATVRIFLSIIQNRMCLTGSGRTRSIKTSSSGLIIRCHISPLMIIPMGRTDSFYTLYSTTSPDGQTQDLYQEDRGS